MTVASILPHPLRAERRFQVLRALLLGACSLSLAGSLWAFLVPSDCGSCEQASALFNGFNLAALGIAFYAHLLIVLAVKGPSRYANACVMVAAGVHMALAGLLLSRRIVCPPCFLTASGAVAMMLAALALSPGNRRRATIILPVVILLTVLSRPLLSALQPDPEIARRRHLMLALKREEQEPPVPAGTVRILAYVRPGCSHCTRLRQEIMPVITREFGDVLDIHYRLAWKGLRTPTLIFRGRKQAHLVGVRSVASLRNAIRLVNGTTVTDLHSER